jgi:hypothetical protein
MKWFFDTSVLVPTFLEDHEHHAASLKAFLKADKRLACCGAHSLAQGKLFPGMTATWNAHAWRTTPLPSLQIS